MNPVTAADPIVVSAARWFWWIAGLSLVNTVLFHSGSSVNFIVGLALTTLANVFFSGNLVVDIVANAAILGFFVLIGLKAQQGQLWAFYVGMAVYTIDAVIYVFAQDWFPVGFHAFALYCIYRGVARLKEQAANPPVENQS